MNSRWLKILLALAIFGIALYAIAFFFAKQKSNSLTQFINERNSAAHILQQIAKAPDTDLSNLSDFELRNDWTGALKIINEAFAKNGDLETLIKELVLRTESLSVIATDISDPELRKAAASAVDELKKGNASMLIYFDARAKIFAAFENYYSSLASGRTVVAPNLTDDLVALNAAATFAKIFYQSFNEKLAEFDKATGLK